MSKESKAPFLKVKFEDNSIFNLPVDWEDVFVDYYGHDPKFYPTVAEKLRLVTEKYISHQAWPSKFDGLTFADAEEIEVTPIERYDDPDFYFEKWDSWGEEGKKWGRRKIKNPPKWADVAEAVMYQTMRGGILQKGLQQLGSRIKVVSANQFLKELGDQPVQNDTHLESE